MIPNWLKRVMLGLLRAVHPKRRVLALLSVVLISIASYWLAYWLRFDGHWPSEYTSTFLISGVALLTLRVLVAVPFHLYDHQWRYSGTRDLVEIILATGISTAAFWVVVRLLPLSPTVPNAIILLETILAAYLIAGSRLIYRLGFEWIQRRKGRPLAEPRRSVLIVGAGEAGSLISLEMSRYPEFGFQVLGFVDDDPAKIGSRLRGIPVLGATTQIPALVEELPIFEIILAIPSAGLADLRRIIATCEGTAARLTILPHDSGTLQGGRVQLSQLRDVRIEDLLAREPVRLALPELEDDLTGQSVLITGAAGSIGSELARQVAAHSPGRLVLFDQAETPLFYLDMELRDNYPELGIECVVGDILDDARVAETLRLHDPTRIYHAAAYKHVPLMERNASEAVRNNVVGTWKLADAAGGHGVEKFVLVSTDKAVNPSCVMGRTKRTAELALLALAERYPQTHFTAVRFGNVMGSQGSVIPIFRRQLAADRPLTVTHPDVTRYFMTIPEAVQLVLQASLLPEARGHITMLDMGEPVRILDMARHFLRLAGVENPDARIEIIGLRPGEKLHEELTFEQEETRASRHEQVRVVARGEDSVWRLELMETIQALRFESEAERDAETLLEICTECCRPEGQAVELATEVVQAGEARV